MAIARGAGTEIIRSAHFHDIDGSAAHKLIFGVQMDLDDAIVYIKKYVKEINESINISNDDCSVDSDNSSIYSDDSSIDSDDSSVDNKYYYYDDIVDKLNLSIKLIKAPCCYFNDYGDEHSKVYLGVELCYNNIISRFDISSFDTFKEYNDFYTDGVKNTKKELKNNKKQYIKDLKKILPKTMIKPRFYSLPNDCYSCT